MKKIIILIVSLLFFTGCNITGPTNEKGESTREFKFGETATLNETDIKINSVKKILTDCVYENHGKCEEYEDPENDYFLLVDLTIKNNRDKDLQISSISSFELRNTNGEKGEVVFFANFISNLLDGTLMPNDMLNGQIAFDVKETNEFYFYYNDSSIGSPIKFVINKSDIIE